jgi:hypothetical protein
MTDYTTADIVNFSAAQQPLRVGDAFDAILRGKIQDKLSDYQANYNQAVFNTAEDEAFDPEDEDLDLDDDLEDLDLDDDLEDLDLDDDLEDLEDDLDGDDTDEDA